MTESIKRCQKIHLDIMKISLNNLLSALKFRVLLGMRAFYKCANYIEIEKANITKHVTNEKNMFFSTIFY